MGNKLGSKRGKYLIMSSEDKRQMILDIAQIISAYGAEGCKIGDILNDSLIEEKYSNIDKKYLNRRVKVDIPKILGKITVGNNNSTKYIIDDLDIAVQLINNYYDNKMSESELWNLRKDICEYIIKNPGTTTKTVCSEFLIDQKVIDEMNSDLVNYGVGIDFYKSTGRGEKMRINEPDKVLGVILNKISESKPKEVQEKKVPLKDNLVEMDERTRKCIQERLLRIIYSKDGIKEDEIAREYEKLYSSRIMYPTIRSMMSKVNSVNHSKGGDYWIKNITEALESVNPKLEVIQFEAVSKTPIEENDEIHLSRNFEGLYIYKVELVNDSTIFMKILNLMINNVSIDSKIRNKVMEAINHNMKYGKRFLM